VRIVFLGTPAFAVPVLEALLRGPDEVVGVVSQPDRPQGRGLAVPPTPVAACARAAGIPLLQPERLHAPENLAELARWSPELLVTCAFGRILRKSLLELPARGCWNVHASLLPRHRGASPVPRAILAGDSWTGITIFRLEEGMDTGPMLLQRMEPVRPDDTAGSLADRLSQLGGAVVREACDRIRAGTPPLVPQEEDLATYAPLLTKGDGVLAWNRPADQIERFVRAMDPWPGATTKFRGQPVRVHAVAPLDLLDDGALPGTIVATEPETIVSTLPGHVRLVHLQAAGRKAMPAGEWARGMRVAAGERFEW
jgi:methionyl-tRNA formyltransferase